jgi:hypothetical protein
MPSLWPAWTWPPQQGDHFEQLSTGVCSGIGPSTSSHRCDFLRGEVASADGDDLAFPHLRGHFFFGLHGCAAFSGGVESARAKVRANTAAQRLQLIANEGPVLLLGHGFMNRLIAKQLESAGGFAEKAAVRGTGAQRSIK